MSDPQPSSWRSALDYFKPRNFLRHEWPYLLVLALAVFGIAYTSFARTPMTLYWIILAPLIGAICVVSRWPELPGRDERFRLIWTQVAHWIAVLVAIRLVFIADVERMMNSRCQRARGADAARARHRHGRHPYRLVAHLPGRRAAGGRRAGRRLARAVGAAADAAAADRDRHRRPALLAPQARPGAAAHVLNAMTASCRPLRAVRSRS